MEKQKYYEIETFGCQMNSSDSERMAGQLVQLGYAPAEKREQADLILLNTCCVRESAENKIYGKIGELKHLKKAKPGLIIVVAGCMAQKNQDAIFKRAPHVDIVLGTQHMEQLPELVAQAEVRKGHYMNVQMGDFDFQDLPTKRENKVFAWVPIMNGCNKFCTYCIVPYVRGREKSRPIEDIIKEIRQLASEGYKEITLLGQNVNSYGLDFKDGTDFSTLLRAVNEVDGIERVRYMTSHPRDMKKSMADTISSCDKVVTQMHLPIQSGSDWLLKKMNRGYTAEEYMELVKYIREVMPDVVLTTDLIVGFPGETEEMHQETLELLRKVRYDMAYTFIYSPRSGTPAAAMTDQVPLDVKKRRLQELMDVQNEISLALNKEMEGKIYSIIVEGPTRMDENHWFGRTSGNKMIIFPKEEGIEIGDTVDALVEAGQTWVLKGRILR